MVKRTCRLVYAPSFATLLTATPYHATAHKMTLPIESLLPLYGMAVTLRFNQKTRLHFFHQTGLAPFIRYLAGSPENIDRLIKIDAPESGRQDYLVGDCYCFSVYGLNGSETLLAKLISALQQLPFSACHDDPAMPFRRNVELDALHDAFSKQPIKHFQQLSPYHLSDLQKECQFWQGLAAFRVQLLSPVRLLKDKSVRENLKGEARYCRQISDLSAALLSNRLYDSLSALLSKQELTPVPVPVRSEPDGLRLSENSHLFWLNIHYTDAKTKAHEMGGMLGEMALDIPQPDSFDWSLWVLGQYTGFGQRSAFGWGRYQLQTLSREPSCYRVSPAASLLTAARATENVITAFEHIENNLKDQPVPADFSQDGSEALLERLQGDFDKLLNKDFKPPPLQAFTLTKADGNLRHLAVPPFRDRVLQRAVSQVLAPVIDNLHYHHSYGFRQGRSRLNARYAIQSAWREGYRWVYESDIDDFFDSVCWQRLQIRIRALWGNDPLVEALLAWMQAPVIFDGRILQRARGLPQGSPLSPLLANIMLDDFDHDMQALGFKLIRFADDFVVLCKSPEQAEQAHQAAVASLQDHGLQLNSDKTHIRSMDSGFHYLGYLFVNDMALESPKSSSHQPVDADIARCAWLKQLADHQPKALEAPATAVSPKLTTKTDPFAIPPPSGLVSDAIEKNTAEVGDGPGAWMSATTGQVPLHYGERDDYGLLLCVTGEHALISTQEERICIQRDDTVLYDVPWRHLQAVLLLGRHTVTTPALVEAMQFNVPLHFASLTGKYNGVVWHGEPAGKGCQLWLKQQAVFTDSEKVLTLSREIVNARLQQCRETLRLRNQRMAVDQIDAIIDKLATATSLAELNGFEGSATRLYFAAFKALVPAEFMFTDRNRQPPRDPFNALLSLGYTVLYSCLESILRADGLLPWQGFYHQPHGRHATLASDLMEPFRHIVERLALALLKRHELKREHFYSTAQQACYLQTEARNFYLGQLMAKFESKITAKQIAEPKTLFEHIHQQNLALIRMIEYGEPFQAWRSR